MINTKSMYEKTKEVFRMMNGWWIVLAAFILIIYFILSIVDEPISLKKEDKPLTILKNRYTNGEIDDDEYLRRKKVLLNKK